MDQLKNYIDGAEVAPRRGRYSQIVDPSTGHAYLEAPLSDADDVDIACQAARRAFPGWSRLTPGDRSLLLFRVADALEAHHDEFVDLECRNTGKPRHLMRDEEFPGAIENLRFYAAAARDTRGLSAGRYVDGHESVMRREPLGVCGQVAPWNYPLNMGIWKFGPALAAGNTVVLKPSDTTPVTTLRAAQIIGEILPPGVLNVIAGDRDTGRALVEHPVPAMVSVTGSERAGIEVSNSASRDLKRVSLELGGQAPVLVCSDADSDAAA
ncbi:MAG: aldehyde dehydrogenase family protein, partial [Nocardiopsaceae bacterium]|nr:aldehyde dehydrogenase family protein [Nocardiopsaceae bacterium]